MAHIKRGVAKRKRHAKVLKMAKGYRGRAKNCYRIALERVEKGLQYSYRDRRARRMAASVDNPPTSPAVDRSWRREDRTTTRVLRPLGGGRAYRY